MQHMCDRHLSVVEGVCLAHVEEHLLVLAANNGKLGPIREGTPHVLVDEFIVRTGLMTATMMLQTQSTPALG